MTIAAPNLDDRRFQDLVDDAKRLVMERCPTWTDHNVSDPGVTLIETFAFMTDQLLYRLNRVPDRLYIKFLELIGIRLFPPDGGAHRRDVLAVDAGDDDADRSRRRRERPRCAAKAQDTVVFSTLRPLDDHPVALADRWRPATTTRTACVRGSTSSTSAPDSRRSARCPTPTMRCTSGSIGRRPSLAVALQFDCHIDGVGVDPTDPPLVWEAWTGSEWEAL